MKKFTSVLLLVCLLSALLCGCGNAREEAVIIPPEASPAASPDAEHENPGNESDPAALSFFGAWEVMDFQSAETAALSAEESESYRGAVVTYQPDCVLINGESAAQGLTYKTDGPGYDYDSLIEAYSANLGEWWNNVDTVTCIISDPDADFFGNRLFTVDADTIWIYYGGVFFLAKSVDA